MGDRDVREHEARPRRAGGPVFDLVASKLRRPLVRPGTVVGTHPAELPAGIETVIAWRATETITRWGPALGRFSRIIEIEELPTWGDRNGLRVG